MVASAWNEEIVSFAKAQWKTGASAADISDGIFGTYRINFSRSAVIGKLHRLGLTEQDQEGNRPNRPGRRRRRPALFFGRAARIVAAASSPAIQLSAAAPPSDPEIADFPNRCDLMSLGAANCRFVVGDVKNGDYFFCGGPTINETSWCRHHDSVVHDRQLSTDTSSSKSMDSGHM